LVSALFYPSGNDEVAGPMLASVFLAILLGGGLLVSLVLYLYVTLSGGIMDDEARRRYRNNETLRSR
jgi:hypothetical protein